MTSTKFAAICALMATQFDSSNAIERAMKYTPKGTELDITKDPNYDKTAKKCKAGFKEDAGKTKCEAEATAACKSGQIMDATTKKCRDMTEAEKKAAKAAAAALCCWIIVAVVVCCVLPCIGYAVFVFCIATAVGVAAKSAQDDMKEGGDDVWDEDDKYVSYNGNQSPLLA